MQTVIETSSKDKLYNATQLAERLGCSVSAISKAKSRGSKVKGYNLEDISVYDSSGKLLGYDLSKHIIPADYLKLVKKPALEPTRTNPATIRQKLPDIDIPKLCEATLPFLSTLRPEYKTALISLVSGTTGAFIMNYSVSDSENSGAYTMAGFAMGAALPFLAHGLTFDSLPEPTSKNKLRKAAN